MTFKLKDFLKILDKISPIFIFEVRGQIDTYRCTSSDMGGQSHWLAMFNRRRVDCEFIIRVVLDIFPQPNSVKAE